MLSEEFYFSFCWSGSYGRVIYGSDSIFLVFRRGRFVSRVEWIEDERNEGRMVYS